MPGWASRPVAFAFLGLCGVAAAFWAFAYPASALRYVLPGAAFLASMAVRLVCARTSATSIVFDARGLRIVTSGVDRRIPWSEVTRIVTTQRMLVIEQRDGGATHIPRSVEPDLRAVLALAPKSVAFESRGSEPPKWRRRLQPVLWLFLVVMAMAIYSLVAQEPPP